MLKYFLYILRWIVLAVPGALFFNEVRRIFGIENVYVAMVISQAVMGAVVYFADRLIFTSGVLPVPWEIKPRGVCSECGRVGRCYRVAGERCCETPDKVEKPDFRCEACEVKKIQQMDK